MEAISRLDQRNVAYLLPNRRENQANITRKVSRLRFLVWSGSLFSLVSSGLYPGVRINWTTNLRPKNQFCVYIHALNFLLNLNARTSANVAR